MKNLQVNRRTEYQRRMKILVWFFGVLSLIAVPTFTIYLGAHGNPFELSLSTIGNRPETRLVFLIWTIAMCVYFSAIVFTLVVLTKNARARVLRTLIQVSTWLLLITNLIPFLPEEWPILARIHTHFAIISTVLLVFTLLMLTFTFRSYYPGLYQKANVSILSLLAVSFILYVIFEAKWITEVTGIIGGSIFLFAVMYWLYNENSFDAEDVLASYDLDLARREVQQLESRTKEAYEEYLKLNTKLRIAQVELQEMKKLRSNSK
jgi:hypothetical protein